MRWWWEAALGAGLIACTTTAPPEAPQASDHATEKLPAASFEQSVGAMSDYDVQEAFRKFGRVVIRCVSSGAARIEGIGGEVELSLRIDPRGDVVSAHLSRSTLGDRETEKCILGAAEQRTWPAAKGGIGSASHAYAVDPSVEVTEWSSQRLRPVMSEIHKKVAKCVMPLRGKTWHATMYIDQAGEVAASGVAPPDHESTDQADCLVDALNRFRFGRQRTKLTKVSFTIP